MKQAGALTESGYRRNLRTSQGQGNGGTILMMKRQGYTGRTGGLKMMPQKKKIMNRRVIDITNENALPSYIKKTRGRVFNNSIMEPEEEKIESNIESVVSTIPEIEAEGEKRAIRISAELIETPVPVPPLDLRANETEEESNSDEISDSDDSTSEETESETEESIENDSSDEEMEFGEYEEEEEKNRNEGKNLNF